MREVLVGCVSNAPDPGSKETEAQGSVALAFRFSAFNVVTTSATCRSWSSSPPHCPSEGGDPDHVPALPSTGNLHQLTAQQARNVTLVGQAGGIANAVVVQGIYAYLGIGPPLLFHLPLVFRNY